MARSLLLALTLALTGCYHDTTDAFAAAHEVAAQPNPYRDPGAPLDRVEVQAILLDTLRTIDTMRTP